MVMLWQSLSLSQSMSGASTQIDPQLKAGGSTQEVSFPRLTLQVTAGLSEHTAGHQSTV